MGIVRNAQPAPIALPGLKVEAYGTSTAMPIGLSRDRRALYGAALGRGTILYQSVDDGATWTTVYTFPQTVVGLLETEDGEALALLQNGAGSPGYLYRSTGWSTSHTAATWALVLTTTGGYLRALWSSHAWTFGDDKILADTSRVGFVCEYGAQTTASGDQTTKGTRVFRTTDHGATWTLVLDLKDRYPGVSPLHCHTVAYDPLWDRVWLLYGDTTTAEGASKAEILYSDDRGATWTALPLTTEWVGATGFQSTTIALLRDCIVLGSDDGPGYVRIARKGYRRTGDIQLLAVSCGGTGAQMLANHLHVNRGQAGAPLLGCQQSVITDVTSPIMISFDEGRSLTQLWEDPALRGSNKGVRAVFGPTYNGKIVAWTGQSGADAGSGTHWLLRGEIIAAEPGLLDGTFTATGDGTTTVFTIPHGLGVVPSRYMVWPERALGAHAVTVTSTNLVVTFGAAPANGLALQFGWRAGA